VPYGCKDMRSANKTWPTMKQVSFKRLVDGLFDGKGSIHISGLQFIGIKLFQVGRICRKDYLVHVSFLYNVCILTSPCPLNNCDIH
jgi:hypothetical protein